MIDPFAGPKGGIYNYLSAHDQTRINSQYLRVGVKKRITSVVYVFARQPQQVHVLLGKEVTLSMRHHHPFGGAGGARRVHDGGEIVVAYVDIRVGIVARVEAVEGMRF